MAEASITRDKLLIEQVPATEAPHAKVTVVGVGAVGMACAFSMLVQDVVSELCLVDVVADRLRGEMMDLQHGLAFVKHCTIKADTDYAITAGSAICVVTAGARQNEGESRLQLVQKNTNIFKHIIPKLVEHSPNCIILVISNPVDVLTYVAWKLSGLPKWRVIGSGTNLDSARFRFLMSQRFNIAPSSCHGWVIGEHGDSSVPVWSGVNIAGIPLAALNKDIGKEGDKENWKELHRKVVDSAYEIIKLKGYTSWAIGLSCSAICRAILKNTRNVFAVTVNVKGLHGIEQEVYLSVPCVLGQNGVTHIVKQSLESTETAQLQASAKTISDVQAGIQF